MEVSLLFLPVLGPAVVVLVCELVAWLRGPAPVGRAWIAPVAWVLCGLMGFLSAALVIAGFVDTQGDHKNSGLLALLIFWPTAPAALATAWLWGRLAARRRWVFAVGALLLSVLVLLPVVWVLNAT
ncbi:hypothetical protein SAMN05445756_2193 [Kytococcus aerolatus]|uniref:Uncharacterized protein n=1 Tax=Kytococcus aerolatus TaxID=592308 RepID=A0A212U7N9_9MICO|nr:hypothetical protein [Kytococcus aerolatus]SNC74275.1 hypothetical protein SAMN05445756_2193 [Kytococcus aerolatus]